MISEIRTLQLNLLAKTDEFSAGLNDAQLKVNKFSKNLDKYGRQASLALVGIGAAAFKAVSGAEEAAVANNRLANVLKQMGVESATKRVTEYADSLELALGVDADLIKLTQAKLATFSNLNKTINETGGAFDRATKAALDMAAAGFGEASANAVQLGKALNDPIKGITALSKSGITFTEQEKAKIETLVKSGEVLKAQDLILQAIEMQVGGTAEATATASDKMKLSFDAVAESIGSILLPYFQKFSDFIIKFTPTLQANSDLIVTLGAGIVALAGAIKVLQFGIDAVNTVIKIATGIQWLWNIALNANPIGLIVLGLTALTAAVVVAYQKIEPFRNLIDSLWASFKRLIDTIANSSIGQAVSKAFNAVTGSRAAGGSVSAGQAYRVGEFGPETFIPNSSGRIVPNASMGGNVTINLNGIIDAESARRSIEKLLQDSARRTGAVNFVGATL